MAGAFPQSEFGQLKGQARLANIAEAKRTDYWGGVLWVYHSEITNDSDGSGNIAVEVVPGVDNEMEILYGSCKNGDSTNRIGTADIEDGDGNIIARLTKDTVTPNNLIQFPAPGVSPTGQDSPSGGGAGRLFLAGEMVLKMILTAVAASQNAFFGVVCRIRGDAPTATEMGNGSSPTIQVNTNRFF